MSAKHVRRRLSAELRLLNRQIDRLVDHDIAHSTEFHSVLESGEFRSPPKAALLTMATVRRLHRYRHRGARSRARPPAPIYVVEPQDYNAVAALTHAHWMLEAGDRSHGSEEGQQVAGYFYSGKSGLARSGSGGGDRHGDLWWVANGVLLRWIERKRRRAEELLSDVHVGRRRA